MTDDCGREHRLDLGSTEEVAWALHRELYDDLPVVLRLEYDGEPVSKSRARFTGRGSKVRTYTPEKTRTAEERVVALARQAGHRAPPDDQSSYGIFAKFFCGTWQRRDVDNMLKLVADALTGVVWVDDSQVSEMSAAVQRGVPDARTHVLIYKTKAALRPVKPCGVCGVPVKQNPSQVNRYCSRECRDAARRTTVAVSCETCGESFSVKTARVDTARFCSRPCRSAGAIVDLACTRCGTAFQRPRSVAGRRSAYCSAECAAAVARERRTVNAKGTCSDCGGTTSKKTYARCRACSYTVKAAS